MPDMSCMRYDHHFELFQKHTSDFTIDHMVKQFMNTASPT